MKVRSKIRTKNIAAKKRSQKSVVNGRSLAKVLSSDLAKYGILLEHLQRSSEAILAVSSL